MLHALSLAEIDEQHVELLPTRTLMSLMMTQGSGSRSTPGSPGEGVSEGPGDPVGGLFDGFLAGLGLFGQR
jgi:hypothetical protein